MKFHLSSNRVESLEIKPIESREENKNRFNFTSKCVFNESAPNEFVIKFDFDLTSDEGFIMFLKHDFIFHTDEAVSDEFLKSHYPSVNAPAIAYPYLRAFVSTVLHNAGLGSVTLPAINFVEHAKKNKPSE